MGGGNIPERVVCGSRRLARPSRARGVADVNVSRKKCVLSREQSRDVTEPLGQARDHRRHWWQPQRAEVYSITHVLHRIMF